MGAAGGGAAGLATLAAAYFLSQFYRSFLTVLYPALSRDVGLDPGSLSDAQGAWFVVFALAQFPIGWALDRIGPRRTGAVLLALGGGGGAALFATATEPWHVVLAMGAIGLGCAPVLMASLYIFGRVFPVDRFALYSAMLIGLGTLGNVAASAPLTAAVEALGWRAALWAVGLVTLLIAAGLAVLVRDPQKLPRNPGDGGLAALLRLRALWPIIPLMAVNYAPAGALRAAWTGPYYSTVFGFEAEAVGLIALAMALAMAAGTFAYGPLDRLAGSRKRVAMVGNVIMTAALALLFFAPASAAALSIGAFVAVGLFGVSYPVLMAHGRAFLPAHLLGRGVTLLNFFSIGGAGLLQLISGGVYRQAAAEGGALAGFEAVFALYAATLAASLAIYAFSRDAPPERAAP